jgi:tRNA G26 N,N-dimethylase Trm1
MSNRTFVCVDCRTAKRAEAAYGLSTDNRCPGCQQEMRELSQKWRIPKRGKKDEWEIIRKMLEHQDAEWPHRRKQIGQAKLEKIDKELVILSGYFKTPQVEDKIKKVEFQRKQILKTYSILEALSGKKN